MTFGIFKEDPMLERRVALTPVGVQTLIEAGNVVYIQHDAGLPSMFRDEEYQKAGAIVTYSPGEMFARSEILLRISPPQPNEISQLGQHQSLLSFLHLAVSQRKTVEKLLEQGVTTIGFELIENNRHELAVLQVMSEIAGQLAIQLAANYLQSKEGGRGILLGNIPGLAPASVVILGAGTVGRTATRVALALGAEVTVLDNDLSRLRDLHNYFPMLNTAVANPSAIARAARFADVLLGAVLLKGARAPHLVTEAMIREMKTGSVIIDVSIDQGGCVETSRPTTIQDPVFIRHGVVHYCVPNMTAAVSRTASNGLTNALLPYLLEIADRGLHGALMVNPGLAAGVCTYRGSCTQDAVAKVFDVPSKRLVVMLNQDLETMKN